MKKKCIYLENYLKRDDKLDINSLDLFQELKMLRDIIHIESDTLVNILNYIKNFKSFPNAYIAYRVVLTVPVTVASAEMSRDIIHIESDTLVNILNYIKNFKSFPNAYIAYRVVLTVPVTVASAERSFSKLKLIKNYLRSTMSQERLNGLAILSIEKDFLKEIDYEYLITQFASSKTRKVNFV